MATKTKNCKHNFQVIEKYYPATPTLSVGFVYPQLEEVVMFCPNCGEVRRVKIKREETK